MLKGKKILFVSQYAGFAGGIERYIYQTTELLRGEGAEVWGLFNEPSRDYDKFVSVFDHVCQPGELPSADFDLAGVHKITDIEFLRKFLEKYGERSALYVHDHDYYCPRSFKYYPYRRMNCHRRYCRLICGVCGMIRSPKRWTNGIFAEIDDKFTLFRDRIDLLHRFPHVIVISSFMRDNLLSNGFTPATLHVIPPCVQLPPERSPRSAKEEPEILFVGQLIRGKGADLFLQTLTKLKRPYHARIIGDGNDRPWLERMAGKLGLGDKVDFMGWVTPPDDFFAEADLALLPFRWQEPFGLVVAESASWGLPVAAFELGGVNESLIDGVNGFCVKERDIASLAEKTDMLLASHELRLKMGQKGRELVRDKFSVAQYLKGFARLLNNDGF